MARNDEDFLLALKLQNELDGLDVKLVSFCLINFCCCISNQNMR